MTKLFRSPPGPNVIQNVQISTAVNTLPVPILYGTPRSAPNVIWLNGFHAIKANSTNSGKGGGAPTGYNYYASFIAAICEGPISGNPLVKYIDGTAFPATFTFNDGNQVISSLAYQNGNYLQLPPPDIVTLYPAEALAYRGTAYALGEEYRIDSTATIPQIQLITPGFFAGTCPLNDSTIVLFNRNAPFGNITVHLSFADADPASCIEDLLTNTHYGAGFPGTFIDPLLFSTANATIPAIGDATYQTYCQAVGLGFSVALDTAESANSILSRWADLTNSAWVWTGLILKIIPYGDRPVSQNPGYSNTNPFGILPKYYNPNITPLFAFTDNDYEQGKDREDPFTQDRKDPLDKYNAVRLNFKDRFNAYNDNVAEARDENLIELGGLRVENIGDAREFSFMNYASISAQLRLQRNVAIDRKYKFRLSWAWCFLEPMDIVTVTDTTLGITNQPVRITSIEEDEHGILSIEAEIMPVGSATAVLYPRQANIATQVSLAGAAPSRVFEPVIFEPTLQMATALSLPVPSVFIGLTGGVSDTFDPNWGGAFVYVSADNVTYNLLGTITGASRMGLLTASFNSAATTLSVDMGESAAQLDTVTTAQAAALMTLCVVTDNLLSRFELLSYTTATLTSTEHYDLTGLFRGVYGTSPNNFNVGDLFLRIDPTTFEASLPSQFVGDVLYVKFISFSPTGAAVDTLASVSPYVYLVTGAGTTPLNNPLFNALANGVSPQDLGHVTDTAIGGPADCQSVTLATALTIDLGNA